ncbi:S26 family signal peptidase [Candidatus Saccharibacteria bacterium]|nr:S26 family signal peptidase [Candidatus Saccharibacteria bacterium]
MSQEARKKRHYKIMLVRRVVGRSMTPILDPGQVVVAIPWRRYQAEDVVLLSHQGKEKIKRIRMIDSKSGKYDVRGDNPSQSTDSRHFGLIEHADIVGKVIWPWV